MNPRRSLNLLVICFLTLFGKGLCYLEYDGWISIELSHALSGPNSEKYTYRGNITIPSLNSGLSSVTQEILTDEQRKNLKMLAEQNKFYQLEAKVVYANGMSESFRTFSRACSLLLSQLNDVLWVSIDGTGFVTAITQTPTSSADFCTGSELSTAGLEDFNTDVLIKHTELAPTPDTASFIQKVEREREARERGDVRDNRGFLAKYWMYIVPVVLLLLISGATNQEGPK